MGGWEHGAVRGAGAGVNWNLSDRSDSEEWQLATLSYNIEIP